MSTYFTHFPIIKYDGVSVRDISRRTNFIQSVLSSPYVFLPYTIKDGEKPEDIAHNYYGTVAATWLVLMANNIVDPYTQWPMTVEMLAEYITNKYSEISGYTGADVVYWAQDETRLDNIVYYYNVTSNDMELRVSPDTFPYIYDINDVIIGREVTEGWSAMRVYDFENIANEAKREIQVVERIYYEQVTNEFKRIIKQ